MRKTAGENRRYLGGTHKIGILKRNLKPTRRSFSTARHDHSCALIIGQKSSGIRRCQKPAQVESKLPAKKFIGNPKRK